MSIQLPLEYSIFHNLFPEVDKLRWEDVLNKLDFEVKYNKCNLIKKDGTFTAVCLDQEYAPKSVGRFFEVAKNRLGVNIMHIYVSPYSSEATYGNHVDKMDVFIVAAMGRVSYYVDDKKITLNPGDGLWLPQGVYHNPIVTEPRVTFSFSW